CLHRRRLDAATTSAPAHPRRPAAPATARATANPQRGAGAGRRDGSTPASARRPATDGRTSRRHNAPGHPQGGRPSPDAPRPATLPAPRAAARRASQECRAAAPARARRCGTPEPVDGRRATRRLPVVHPKTGSKVYFIVRDEPAIVPLPVKPVNSPVADPGSTLNVLVTSCESGAKRYSWRTTNVPLRPATLPSKRSKPGDVTSLSSA